MPDLVPVRRALLSVSDKTGLVDFARALVEEFKVELISTGGTAKALREAGLTVTDVSEVTGFPEIMDGRVKTLHPNIHAGILADRDNPEHMAALEKHGIKPIDLVCVNLYPFEKTVAKPNVSYEEAIENIDIGGPAMIRAAAKNHSGVLVVTDPSRYEKVLGDLHKHGGSSCQKHRQKMAMRAFGLTAEYDDAITVYLDDLIEPREPRADKAEAWLDWYERYPDKLRYGENPHQKAFLIRHSGVAEANIPNAIQHHGKQLSYINVLDADAALDVVKEWNPEEVAVCCVVKHATPCGVGIGADVASAFGHAYAGDPLAAFGGIVAFNKAIDGAAAEAMISVDKLVEVIVAPGYETSALERLKERWKNVRILEVGPILRAGGQRQVAMSHKITGGHLEQQRDLVGIVESEWKVVTRRAPTAAELRALKFNWLVAKHVKSNAVVVGGEQWTYGIGGGQVDRVAAAEQAVKKAGERAVGAVAASDAFFPFPDGPQVLIHSGVTAIVQPGGSVRDQATIDLCDAAGVAMIFTGRRHFRH